LGNSTVSTHSTQETAAAEHAQTPQFEQQQAMAAGENSVLAVGMLAKGIAAGMLAKGSQGKHASID
jgi:hypothetical protein